MTLPSQQFYLRGTLFNVHNTLMKHVLRLTKTIARRNMTSNLIKKRTISVIIITTSTETYTRRTQFFPDGGSSMVLILNPN